MGRQARADKRAHRHGVHAHDHDHVHSHAPVPTSGNQRSILLALVLTATFMAVEVAGGLIAGSLALIADAGHMLTDAAALALAWAGFHFGKRPSTARKTFGYQRLEVLAGFVNALTLLALVLWVAWEAILRLQSPSPVLAGPMLAVAALGLIVNIVVFLILRRADTSHVNIRGAMLHVMGDLLGSVTAIVGAIFIHFTGWTPIDSILSLLIVLLIVRSAWSLLKNSLHILLEGVPPDVDIPSLEKHLVSTVEGVERVDHVHVWSITSGQPAATLEAGIRPQSDPRVVTRAIKRALAEDFGIAHSTVEIVWDEGSGCVMATRMQGSGHHGAATRQP
ncbi:cation diffusion facilitator family transporter [Xanthomonadaceae bacterium XH05]|nr:cation diffusion facilitator family transporter [Xanthomonadaceae bacterium XH05]